MLQKLWYDRPVRTQLLIAIGAINLIAALLAGVISIINTRSATRVEIEASLEIAQRFVTATMKDLAAQDRLEQLEEELPLELKHLRHVRIMFMDTMGPRQRDSSGTGAALVRSLGAAPARRARGQSGRHRSCQSRDHHRRALR